MKYEMTRFQRIANKGYGYYLTMKILKAIFSIPVFLITFPLAVALGLLISIVKMFQEAWEELPGLLELYKARNWFTGFSYSKWSRIYRRPEPTAICTGGVEAIEEDEEDVSVV